METAPSLPTPATPAATTAATEAATKAAKEAAVKIETSKDSAESTVVEACTSAAKEEAVGAAAGIEEITKYEDSTVEYVLDGKSMGEGKLKITTRFSC